MTTYSLKRKFQDILRPFAYSIDRAGITPNQITSGTCLLSLAYAVLIVLNQKHFWVFFLFPAFFLLRMVLNNIDGLIAKEKNKTSKLGALLNEVGDSFSDLFLSSIFFFVGNVNVHYLWAFIYLSILVECAGMWSYYISGERSFAGPLGKSDRGIVLTLISFILGFGILKAEDYIQHVNYILLFSIVLLGITLVNRLRFALKKVETSK